MLRATQRSAREHHMSAVQVLGQRRSPASPARVCRDPLDQQRPYLGPGLLRSLSNYNHKDALPLIEAATQPPLPPVAAVRRRTAARRDNHDGRVVGPVRLGGLARPHRPAPGPDHRESEIQMTASVLLLRHGETALNVNGALRGRLDVPLTDLGHRQAEALAARISEEYVISRLYSSPLTRAVDTAGHIAARWSLSVRPHEAFIDVDYGRWAGLPPTEMSEADAIRYRQWERDPTLPLPGAEAPQQVRERVLTALDEVAIDGEVIAVVSHDAVLQLALAAILQLPLGSYRGLCQATATLNEVRHRGDAWSVVLLNSTWHLTRIETANQRRNKTT